MGRDSLTAVLRSGPAMVVSTLVALSVVGGIGWKAHDLIGAAEARTTEATTTTKEFEALRKELEENRKALDTTNMRLDQFNTRLSWLEGATSGALKTSRPPDVRAAGVER